MAGKNESPDWLKKLHDEDFLDEWEKELEQATNERRPLKSIYDAELQRRGMETPELEEARKKRLKNKVAERYPEKPLNLAAGHSLIKAAEEKSPLLTEAHMLERIETWVRRTKRELQRDVPEEFAEKVRKIIEQTRENVFDQLPPLDSKLERHTKPPEGWER